MLDTNKLNAREQILEFAPANAICVELGVAEGKFSEKLLQKREDIFLYGVDIYAGDRGHNDEQHKKALARLAKFKNRHQLIRDTFSNAAYMFQDEFFDLVYIDGYAHTAQDNGRTLYDWYPKLKKGGVFSGDDYSLKYAANMGIIDNFCQEKNLKISVINDWNSHRTWLCRK